MKIQPLRVLSGLVLAMALNPVVQAISQGTAFTYQGRLNDGPGPATGSYDLQFTLYDAPNVGNIVAGSVISTATAVSNGLFSIALDFGKGTFSGSDRWLEIGVRTNTGTLFTLINPRQKITAAPYSITAASISGAVPVSQLDGILSLSHLPTAVLTNGAQAAGDLSGKFPNPVIASNAVTTQKIADGAITSAKIAPGAVTPQQVSSDLIGAVQQVIHGVASFGGSTYEVVQTFSPSIDPIKSYVLVGKPVSAFCSGSCTFASGATLIDLTTNSVRIAVDGPPPTGTSLAACRVGFQIIQSK